MLLKKICLTINPSVYEKYKEIVKNNQNRDTVSSSVQRLVESEIQRNDKTYWRTNNNSQ